MPPPAKPDARKPGIRKPDEAALRERLDRIGEIFGQMVGHAEVQALTRCPYRDRRDLCTAHIRCRSQLRPEGGGPPVCTHDGTFDYRLAWDSKPGARERAKRKIRAIREDAAARRRDGGG